jgi:putative ABC transport system permease protein
MSAKPKVNDENMGETNREGPVVSRGIVPGTQVLPPRVSNKGADCWDKPARPSVAGTKAAAVSKIAERTCGDNRMSAQFNALVLNMFEQGFLFAFLGLGVLITFRFFRFPDLTAEGSYPLGGAVAAALLVQGTDAFAATFAAAVAGGLAGIATALIHTKLRINNIIAGIIVMTALYTINLRVMGKANTPLLTTPSVFSETVSAVNSMGFSLAENVYTTIPIAFIFLVLASAALIWFFATDLGLAVRATGQNEAMITALGVNTDRTKVVGLALSNGFIALSGALVAQNHGFADIGMGIGILVTGAAAVLIGEAIFGDRTVAWWIVAAIVGVLIYRLLVALALRVGFEPVDLRLITAVLLLLALALPQLRTRLLR